VIHIVGGERVVREAMARAAAEREREARVVVGDGVGELPEGDVLVDLGLPPRDWPAGEALVGAERERVAGLARAVPAGGRVVRGSVLGAGSDAPTVLQRAQGAAEEAWRGAGVRAVAMRPGILLGDCGLVRGMRRMVERFRLVLIPGVGDAKLEPLLVDDFAAYCVEATITEGALEAAYDLGCGEILTGGLLARDLADNLGLSRWVLGVPGFLAAVLVPALSHPDFPGIAVRRTLEALAGGLLPRGNAAWTTFPVQPADLRESMAAAAGMDYPIRKRGQGRFGAWRAPKRTGILWSKSDRRRR